MTLGKELSLLRRTVSLSCDNHLLRDLAKIYFNYVILIINTRLKYVSRNKENVYTSRDETGPFERFLA